MVYKYWQSIMQLSGIVWNVARYVKYAIMIGGSVFFSVTNASVVDSETEAPDTPKHIPQSLDINFPLDERVRQARDELWNGDLQAFKSTAQTILDAAGPEGLSEFSSRLYELASYNDIDLLAWLIERCPDCAVSKTGSTIIHSMGSGFEGQPWRGIDFDTFKYLYDQGAVDSFERKNPDVSIVTQLADYWIPEGGGIYGDYETTTADRDNEQTRVSDRLKMLSFLFDKGHDVNSSSYDEKATALLRATQANDKPLFDFLLDNGADPEIGRNPLSVVTGDTSPDILNSLLKSGLDPNTVTGSAFSTPSAGTVLGRIVEGGHFEPDLLEILDAHDLDVTVVDGDGKTAIDYATSEFGKTEQPYTRYLLERGAVKTDQYSYSILIEAIKHREQESLREVLSSHAFLANGLDAEEKVPPLELAIRMSNTEGFETLLNSGATLSDGLATHLLEEAIFRKSFDIAELVLQAHPSTPVNRTYVVNGQSFIGSPVLQRAAGEAGSLEWVHRLIDRGAILDGGTARSFPVYAAALNGYTDVVNALLEAGSMANPVDADTGKSLTDTLEEFSEKYPDSAEEHRAMIKLLQENRSER